MKQFLALIPRLLSQLGVHDGRLDSLEAAPAPLLVDGSVASTGQQQFNAGIKSDTVDEKTAAAGVTVDGLLIKDGGIAASGLSSGTLADARVAQSNVTQHQAAIALTALSGYVAAQHRELYLGFFRSTSSTQALSTASETNLNLQGASAQLGSEFAVNVSDEVTFSNNMSFVAAVGFMNSTTTGGTRSTAKVRIYRHDASTWGSPLDEGDVYLRNAADGKDGQSIAVHCFTDILSTHKLQLRGVLGGSSGATNTQAFGSRLFLIGVK